jgi:hypothetical protein
MIQPDKLRTCRLFWDYVWILGSGHLCLCLTMLSASWDNKGQGSRFQRDKLHVLAQFIAHKLYSCVTVFMFISSLFVRVSQDFPTSRLPFLIISHFLSNFFPITTSFLSVSFTEFSSHFTSHCRRSELTFLVSFFIFSYWTSVHVFFPYSFIKFGLLVNFKHEFLCEKVSVIKHMLCGSEHQFRLFYTISCQLLSRHCHCKVLFAFFTLSLIKKLPYLSGTIEVHPLPSSFFTTFRSYKLSVVSTTPSSRETIIMFCGNHLCPRVYLTYSPTETATELLYFKFYWLV